MTTEEGNNRFPEFTRKMIFLALVSAQDLKMSVTDSRKLIVERFKVTDGEVRQIEIEGVENQWPPLGIHDASLVHTQHRTHRSTLGKSNPATGLDRRMA